MKRLEKEDLIKTIYRMRDFRVFLIGIILVLIFLSCTLRGDLVRAKADYETQINSLKEELVTAQADKVMAEEELAKFKEENLQLYKDLTNSYQMTYEQSFTHPVDLKLVFIDGYAHYYDAFHSNVLYYYSENGILIPQYHEDGTVMTFDNYKR